MGRHMHLYPDIEIENRLRNNHEMTDFNDSSSPPAYCSQASDSDWKHEIIEVKSLRDHTNVFGFTISGGIDHDKGPWIVITHIDSPSKNLADNGRQQLHLFDRILTMNNINFEKIRHTDAVQMFADAQGHSIKLHIYRINPRHIESIDVVFSPDTIEPSPLGITISGGLDNNKEDPGIFITYIDPYGFLGSYDRFRLNDRLLEIKTNFTSVNLRWLTHDRAVHLIRRICEDDRHVTFVVSHQQNEK